MKHIVILFAMLLFFVGCSNDSDTGTIPAGSQLIYPFTTDAQGWQGGFADYAQEREEIYELVFARTTLPEPLDTEDGALYLSGNNHSDDLFMYITRKYEGLEPNTTYALTFTVEFASNVADGMIGVGGSPGEGVLIKVGAVPYAPERVLDENGWYRMNIDKGNQANGGKDMMVIGDFSNDTDQNVYALKTVQNETPFFATSNENGELWFIVGTDSGFEATTSIYYNTIEIHLSQP
jgi:hypothetical protein